MSARRAKVPREQAGALTFTHADVIAYSRPMFRIHRVTGAHPMQWDTFRQFGPLSASRWDPHPPPRDQRPGFGVIYTATDYITAFAEVFQRHRKIDLTADDRSLSGWAATRPLQLLDLTGN